MPLLLAQLSAGDKFDGFEGLSLALLTIASLLLGGWIGAAAVRWFVSRPRLPEPMPPTNELGSESAAIANFLVNRCKVTRLAVPATFLDLAAKKLISVDMLDLDHGVVRLRAGADPGKLPEHERHIYSLIQSRATGGSAPLEVLEVHDSDKWFKSFRKHVVAEARRLHLAANRWTRFDYIGLGGSLAVIYLLFAAAFATADLFVESNPTSDEDFTRGDWLWVAGIGWAVSMAGMGSLRSLRETNKGRSAAAHWLGYRDYCRQTKTFEDLPPAAVTVWERYLSCAVAVGSAHDTAEALPFATEDPEVAWSRSTGSWRQIRVEYPRRFGFGQAPWKAIFEGLGRTALFGGLVFFILPVLLPIVFDVRDEVFEDVSSSDEAKLRWVVGGAVLFMVLLALFWGSYGLAGAFRLFRGLGDLGKPVVQEGEVVKVHASRVAIDDGDEETTAWFIPPGSPSLSRGQRIRVTRTPHLHHVQRIEVL
jgi:hypothetical protein